MKVEKLLLQHGAAAGITVVAYQVLTGCDFAQALALVSTYIFILLAIVQVDLWIACHSTNYLEPLSSVYLEPSLGSYSVMGIF